MLKIENPKKQKIKYYPISKYPEPPEHVKRIRGRVWERHTVVYKRRIRVPAYKYLKFIGWRKKDKRHKRRRVYRLLKVKAYSYLKEYEITAWVQTRPVQKKIAKKRVIGKWIRTEQYLDTLERKLHSRYPKIEIIRPMSRYGLFDYNKHYRIAQPEGHLGWTQKKFKFCWKTQVFPGKWKFNLFIIFYYVKAMTDYTAKTYKLLFKSSTFRVYGVDMSLFDILKYEVPKAIKTIQKNMKKSGKVLTFAEFAMFSATTRRIIQLLRQDYPINYNAMTERGIKPVEQETPETEDTRFTEEDIDG